MPAASCGADTVKPPPQPEIIRHKSHNAEVMLNNGEVPELPLNYRNHPDAVEVSPVDT